MFSSPKCNPQLFHLYLFNFRDCKYNNASVGRSYCYLLLQHEETLVCRPLRGCIHSWFRSTSVEDETTLSPQVETSILRETGVLSISLERKQNRSLLFSSFFKKLFQVEGNGAKGNTLRVWPWPRLLFVPAFKLSARQTSQTITNRPTL